MKLPIGIQDFKEIRKGGYLYIDKTEAIHGIISRGKYFFLSRPRRFGKSLLLSTIEYLYEGEKDLFDGLWIADKWDWENQSCPVIHIQFSKSDYQGLGLEAAIIEELKLNASRLGITLEKNTAKSTFFELITKASRLGKVVVLIDEYDKPIIDYLDNIPEANNNRQILKNFYSVLKDSDPYLELVFITGVSRFAKTSIFSDLNNITNLTMRRQAVNLLGITQKELQDYFSESIKEIAVEENISEEELVGQIRYWYNGYSWDGKNKVYNPYSLLSYFEERKFTNYWFETGTPTFLVKAMRKVKLFKMDKMLATDYALDSYDIENLNIITVLFQSGYLTINEEVDQGVYELVYPNNEVRISLQNYLLDTYRYDPLQTGKIKALEIASAFKGGDIDKIVLTVNALFATIPSNLWQKENEAFYHALVHLTFKLVGVFVNSEVNSARGRLDAKVETADTIYILEFKLDKSAKEALNQIQEKGYFKAYQDSPKKKVGIGINFSVAKKEVESFEVAEF